MGFFGGEDTCNDKLLRSTRRRRPVILVLVADIIRLVASTDIFYVFFDRICLRVTELPGRMVWLPEVIHQ